MISFMRLNLVLLSILLLIGCSSNNTTEEETIQILKNELEEKLFEKESIIKNLTESKSNLEEELCLIKKQINKLEEDNKDLQEELLKLTDKNNTLNAKNSKLEWENWDYKSLYYDYRKYIDFNISETNLDDSYIKINNIGIGSSYKEVFYAFGQPSGESVGCNESGYGGNSYMSWGYDGDFSIMFDPLFVRRIFIYTSEYNTNFNIKVGDSAEDALRYMDENYKKYYSKHTDEELKGWYYTDNGNVIILYYNADYSRFQNDIKITPDTKIMSIELTSDTFD